MSDDPRIGAVGDEGPPGSGAGPGTEIPWHSAAIGDALHRLGSSEEGLSAADAATRFERYGPNRLTPPRPVSALSILFAQFKSLVVLLLFVASGVALAFGDVLEATAIGAVLVLNTLIGFTVEFRARRAMDALLSYQVLVAKVLRDGRVEAVS
jgi:magnesium-transporting ATPase (P-type)